MPRTKGANKLPQEAKAVILAQKNARLCTNKKIAENVGVSMRTVVNVTPQTVDNETLRLAEQYGKEIVNKWKTAAVLGLDNTINKIHLLNAKDSAIVAATAVDKVQLLTNQPTQITKQLSDLDLARELMERMIQKRGWTEEMAIEGIRGRFPDIEIKLLTGENNG